MKKANSNIDPHSLLSLDTLLSFKKDQIEGEDKTRIAKIIGGSALYSDVVDGLDESSVEQAKSLAARVNSRIQGRVGLSTGESILGRYKFHLIAAAVMIVATVVLVTQNNEPSSSVAPLADNESEENTIESDNDVDVEHPANVDNHSAELEATDAESQMSGDNPPEEPQPTQNDIDRESNEEDLSEKEASEDMPKPEDNSLREDLLWNSTGSGSGDVRESKASTSDASGIKTLGSDSAPTTITASFVHVEFKENLYVYEERKKQKKDKVVGFDYAGEDMPQYPGGDDKLAEDLKYWIDDVKLKTGQKQSASVTVLLTINNKGMVDDISFIGNVTPPVKEKITTAINKADPWSKGGKLGKKGSVIYSIAVSFK